MNFNLFDLSSTGNEIVDTLQMVDIRAQAINDPDLRSAFIEDQAAKLPIDEIMDVEFLVVARTVLVRTLGANMGKRLMFDEGGLMFTGKLLMRNHVVSGAEFDYLTLDYYEPRIAGGEVDQSDSTHLIFQLPVRETEFCAEI